MDKAKRKRLENAGWKVGNAAEFLGLTSVETDLVEMKFALSSRFAKGTRTAPPEPTTLPNEWVQASHVSRRWRLATRGSRWTFWSTVCSPREHHAGKLPPP
jgi:hypothetical protein